MFSLRNKTKEYANQLSSELWTRLTKVNWLDCHVVTVYITVYVIISPLRITFVEYLRRTFHLVLRTLNSHGHNTFNRKWIHFLFHFDLKEKWGLFDRLHTSWQAVSADESNVSFKHDTNHNRRAVKDYQTVIKRNGISSSNHSNWNMDSSTSTRKNWNAIIWAMCTFSTK